MTLFNYYFLLDFVSPKAANPSTSTATAISSTSKRFLVGFLTMTNHA